MYIIQQLGLTTALHMKWYNGPLFPSEKKHHSLIFIAKALMGKLPFYIFNLLHTQTIQNIHYNNTQ